MVVLWWVSLFYKVTSIHQNFNLNKYLLQQYSLLSTFTLNCYCRADNIKISKEINTHWLTRSSHIAPSPVLSLHYQLCQGFSGKLHRSSTAQTPYICAAMALLWRYNCKAGSYSICANARLTEYILFLK